MEVCAGSSDHECNDVWTYVSKIYQHPKFNASTMDYDVSIIELKTPLNFSEAIQPIVLPSSGDSLEAGTLCVVSGWGTNDSSIWKPVDHLQAVSVPVVDGDECQRLYGSRVITDRMICAGFVDFGGKDSCQVRWEIPLEFLK